MRAFRLPICIHICARHIHIGISEHPTTADVSGFGLSLHGVESAETGLLALHLRGEVRQLQHDLLGRGVERALAILQMEKNADSGADELLEDIGGLDAFAAQTALFRHDENVEGGLRLERRE